MAIGRRGLLQALAIGGFRAEATAAEPALSMEVLRGACTVHGTDLSDARLEVVRPALARRLSELRALRSFEIDDSVGPAEGLRF